MSFEWMGHVKTLRHVLISAKVINEEPLRIGAPKEFIVLEDEVLKTNLEGKEVPVIPGSSWKGVFRSGSVTIARSSGINFCDGLPKSTCLEGREFHQAEGKSEGWVRKLDMIISGEVMLCLGCLIFGSQSFHSHVFFTDSYPIGDFSLGYRTGTAISRRTGAAQRRSLYTIEYVEPGCEFSFEMRAENLPNYALGLISSVISLLNLGMLKVGGQKSRGFGKVRFEDLRIKVYSMSHEKYGVSKGKLKPLDPIDLEVPWLGRESEEAMVEGEEARTQLEEFKRAWRSAEEKIRKISLEGWAWIAAGRSG